MADDHAWSPWAAGGAPGPRPPAGHGPPGWWQPPEERIPRRRRRLALLATLVVLVALLAPVAVVGLRGGPAAVPGAPVPRPGVVRIAAAAPSSFDPAEEADVQSAAVVAQLFEGLTALDASLRVQPALAESWRFSDDRSTVTFRLRLGLVFSDGTPITADDVVQCWFRVLDPAHGSTMASLLDDVVGAADYRLGRGSRADVGIHASGRDVVVELVHPASWFPAIAANPTLAVVPPSEFGTLRDGVPSPFVGSGAYVVASATDTTLTLRANDRYWAGPPSVGTVEVVTSLGGRNEVDAFTAGDVDYVAISDGDAGWVRYDRQLGPQLREEPSLSVTYYGFDTRRPPFDDVLVRRAFGAAVDWRRIALLADGPAGVATSIVPPGIPGRSGADFLPAYDPQGARLLLAQAGYPGGRGFPAITLVTAGTTYDEAVVDELREQLGISISLEVLPFDAYGTRLETDPPAMWSESWIADYPAQEDFLGLLLRSDSTANYGRWSDPAFDAELDGAGADQSVASQHYVAAEQIVRDQVPLVPVSYGTAWALSRTGLLGATESGIGIPRFAGLAWSR